MIEGNDALAVIGTLEITDLSQLLISLPELILIAFGIDEERVGIDCFVIADPGNVNAKFCEAFAGFKESTDVVWHVCYISLFHNSHQVAL